MRCDYKERKGKERKGKERKGKERKGKERKGKERKGKERKGKARKRTPFSIIVMSSPVLLTQEVKPSRLTSMVLDFSNQTTCTWISDTAQERMDDVPRSLKGTGGIIRCFVDDVHAEMAKVRRGGGQGCITGHEEGGGENLFQRDVQ
ncbi:MAG: hypothetical protein FRX49_05049 [Trebouxia sp. A1-2]|nr:MAG: hypothetical protein FRX49_05049 [Trebouxia sp. A1-2]